MIRKCFQRLKDFGNWLFSQRSERERMLSNNRRAIRMHDLLIFVLLFSLAVFVCWPLSHIHDDNNQFSVPVFILAVSLIARLTTGYFYGVAASILGVFCVNYAFTYPYMEFDMSISGYPLTFAAMLMVSICISALTSRIKGQEQLRLEVEMEKMRANLLRSVSHDLRTPLTSIVGSSSVLLENETLTFDERHELLQEINKDARWLARITENILSVTKFSGAQVRLNKESEVVEEIVSSAIVKFRKNHPDIRISVQRPQEILLAPMDATLIEQVIVNLFDNAVTHGLHTTQIRVNIRAEGDFVLVRVCDNGVGISREMFAHLFDGQASAFRTHSDDQRSMGIGLSVCQSIIHAHGGEISARNGENGGACFEFSLPAEPEHEAEFMHEAGFAGESA